LLHVKPFSSKEDDVKNRIPSITRTWARRDSNSNLVLALQQHLPLHVLVFYGLVTADPDSIDIGAVGAEVLKIDNVFVLVNSEVARTDLHVNLFSDLVLVPAKSEIALKTPAKRELVFRHRD
jgi:hypothetical protein